MKGFLFGLTLGFTAGVVTRVMLQKDREEMMATLEKLKSNSQDTLDKLMSQKQNLEELLKKKTEELTESRAAES